MGDMNLDEAELSTIFANGMDFNDPELLKEMEEICKASIEDQTLLSNNMTGIVFNFIHYLRVKLQLLSEIFLKLINSIFHKRTRAQSGSKCFEHNDKWNQQFRNASS